VTFHTNARFADATDSYHDREDVLVIDRDYKPGQLKNKNQLPEALVERLIAYSSNQGDVVLDPFLGGFTTARVALRLGRKAWGFEINRAAYDAFEPGLDAIVAAAAAPPTPPDRAAFAKRLSVRQRRQQRRSTLPHAVATVARAPAEEADRPSG
jgi:site-specific DNA-methyltransferase (adenine-specific)